MSLQQAQLNTKVTGDGLVVEGLSMTLNNSLILGFNCAPLATGKSNSFMGYTAAQYVKTGNFNTVMGFAAAQNMSGDGNVFVGTKCALNARYASCNTFVGTDAGLTCSTGGNNALFGSMTDILLETDTGVTALGYRAAAGLGTGAIAIGSFARAQGAQAVALGNDAHAVGAGHLNIANRIRGFYETPALQTTTYALQLNADAVKVPGALAFCEAPAALTSANANQSARPHWLVRLDPSPPPGGRAFSDLVFQSANRAIVRFRDEFWPGIFDYTAQHRCVLLDDPSFSSSFQGVTDLIGRIVIATGKYRDLAGNTDLSVHRNINEAIPVVAMCDMESDPRVFGVVSGIEEVTRIKEEEEEEEEEEADGEQGGHYCRTFSLGHVRFDVPVERGATTPPPARVIVNSGGEGGLWVCDLNGPLRNGDLVTAAGVLGLGMKQSSPIVINSTVAKITCDCDFKHCTAHETILVPGLMRGLKTAFVGCTYKC